MRSRNLEDRQYKLIKKKNKLQTIVYIRQHKTTKFNPTKNRREFRCLGRVSTSCSTMELNYGFQSANMLSSKKTTRIQQ